MSKSTQKIEPAPISPNFDVDNTNRWPKDGITPPPPNVANLITLAVEEGYQLNHPAPNINIKNFQGRWYILFTDFPMWLDSTGTKPNPTKWHPIFNYGVRDTCCNEGCCCCCSGEKGNANGFEDVVMFHPTPESTEYNAIRGYDVPDKNDNTKFKWYGNFPFPFNYMITSNWEFIHAKFHLDKNDPTQVNNPHPDDWAIVKFSETCCTKAGYDIICRTQNPSPTTVQEMIKAQTDFNGSIPRLVSLYQHKEVKDVPIATNCSGTCCSRPDPLDPPCCLCSCGRYKPFKYYNRTDPNRPPPQTTPPTLTTTDTKDPLETNQIYDHNQDNDVDVELQTVSPIE